jgi:hypothetical protein
LDPRIVAVEYAWALPFFLACMLPGAGLLARFLDGEGRARLNAVEFAASAFCVSVASLSLVAIVAWLTGVGLVVLSVVWLVLAVSGGVLLARHVRGLRERLEGGGWGLMLSGVAAVVAMVERPWFFTSSDIFYHVAAVRSLVRSGQVLVTDPIYGTTTRTLDATSGVWHTMQAAFAAPLHIEPSTLYVSALGVGAFVLIAAIWALMRRVTGEARIATAATLLLLVASGRADLRASAYPNEITFGLGLLFIALLARAVEQRDKRLALLAGVVGFASVTMHLGGAEFIGVAGIAFLMWTVVVAWISRRSDTPVRMRTVAYPAVALAVAFVPALPVVVPRLVALRGSSALGDALVALIARDIAVLPGGLQVMVPGHWLGDPWVFWLALAACAWALWRARRGGDSAVASLAAVAIGALPALLLSNPLVAPLLIQYSAHMARRLAKLLQYAPLFGIAWAFGVAVARDKGAQRRAVAVMSVIATYVLACNFLLGYIPVNVPQAVPAPRSIVAAWSMDRRWYWGASTLQAVRDALAGPTTPVVAGSMSAVYQLTGLADIRALAVVEAHSPYHVEVVSGAERRADAFRIVAADGSSGERRALLSKWSVDFVVLDDTVESQAARASMLADTSSFEPVVVTDRLTLLRVRR